MKQRKPLKSAKLRSAVKLLGLFTILALTPLSYGVVGYSTNFDDYDPVNSLSGNLDATTWDTNDEDAGILSGPSVGQSDAIYEPGYSAYAGDYWATLGGLSRPSTVPGQPIAKVFKAFDITIGSGGNGSLLFSVKFNISSSSNSYASKDDFAWSLNDSAGNQLVALRFSPVTTTLTGGGVNDTKLTVNLDRTGASTLTAPVGITYNNAFDLKLTISPTNTLNASLTDFTNTTTAIFTNVDITSSVIATGITPSQVGQVAAEWILKNPTAGPSGTAQTNAGRNALNFNNYSVVPEPSSVALLGIAGFGGLVTMARRRKRMSK